MQKRRVCHTYIRDLENFWEMLSNYWHIKKHFLLNRQIIICPPWDSMTSLSDSDLLSFLLVSQQGESQRRLYRDLLRNYNRLERPVMNDSQPIVVELQLSLLQIIDVVSHWLSTVPIQRNISDLSCRYQTLHLNQSVRGESRLALTEHSS